MRDRAPSTLAMQAGAARPFALGPLSKACVGAAKGAYPELLVVEPAPVPELVSSKDLRLVVGHGVEDVEERVRLELAEVARLEPRGAMPVAVRYLEYKHPFQAADKAHLCL